MIGPSRVPTLLPAAHLAAIGIALLWATRERRDRPTRAGAWRLTLLAAGLAALGDALLLVSPYSTTFARVAFVVGFVAALALLVVATLQGWPHRSALLAAGLAVVAPFQLAL